MGAMEALPEGEWVEAPVGLHTKFVYSVDREGDNTTIVRPEDVAKSIGDRLYAPFDSGKIIINESLK